MLLERLALLFRGIDKVLALVAGASREFRDVHAARLGESQQRGRRIAGGIERRGHRRTLALDHAIRLFVQHV